ncbi:MAG: zinc ribbon domain-containing protein [Mycobacterium sp.]
MGIPITYAFVLVAPAALVRVLDRSSGESLDGFAIGAMGAALVNAASTATFLAPQVAAGMSAGTQPVGSLLAEVMVEGVAWPLGSVAAGGLFGLALWFTPRANASRRYRKSVVIPAAFLGALAFSIAMGFVDVAPVPMSVYLALQLPIALVAILAMRIGITDCLLHEAAGDALGGQLLCGECDHVVIQMAFCSDCGVAIQAAPRTSQAALQVRPEQSGQTAATGGTPGEPQRISSYRNVLGPAIAAVGIAVAATVLVARLLTPAPAAYVCPPDCGRPPLGSPVETNPRYSGDGGAFSVSYPGEGSVYEVTFDPPGMNGVQARYVGGDTGLLNLFGEPALDRTPKQVVEDIVNSKFPEATVAYEIPNASVGYEPGYGVIADVFARGTRMRVIVMAAVRHDYALIATAAGPYHEFTQDYGTGHPSAANLEVAMDMGKYVNSFRWFGDRRVRPQ